MIADTPTITVIAGSVPPIDGRPSRPFDPGEVALWERDDRHPSDDHEVFIAQGTPPVLVARTEMVADRLKDGRLISVEPETD